MKLTKCSQMHPHQFGSSIRTGKLRPCCILKYFRMFVQASQIQMRKHSNTCTRHTTHLWPDLSCTLFMVQSIPSIYIGCCV